MQQISNNFISLDILNRKRYFSFLFSFRLRIYEKLYEEKKKKEKNWSAETKERRRRTKGRRGWSSGVRMVEKKKKKIKEKRKRKGRKKYSRKRGSISDSTPWRHSVERLPSARSCYHPRVDVTSNECRGADCISTGGC